MEIDIYTKLGRNFYKRRPELGENSPNYKRGEERGAACSADASEKLKPCMFWTCQTIFVFFQKHFLTMEGFAVQNWVIFYSCLIYFTVNKNMWVFLFHFWYIIKSLVF
jgi:hypothetical protein